MIVSGFKDCSKYTWHISCLLSQSLSLQSLHVNTGTSLEFLPFSSILFLLDEFLSLLCKIVQCFLSWNPPLAMFSGPGELTILELHIVLQDPQ